MNVDSHRPRNWRINGINITDFKGNGDALNDTGKHLLNKTEDWFKGHPNATCPPKFKKTAKDITNSSAYRNKQKKRERKVAAAEAARAEGGDDDGDLCSLLKVMNSDCISNPMDLERH